MANDYITKKAKEFAIQHGFVQADKKEVAEVKSVVASNNVVTTQDMSAKLDKETAKALIEFARNGIDKDASNDSAQNLLDKVRDGIKDVSGNIVYRVDQETIAKFSRDGKLRKSGSAIQDSYITTTILYEAEKTGRKELTVADAVEILKKTRAEFVDVDSKKPFSSGEYARLRTEAVKELDYFKSSFGLN